MVKGESLSQKSELEEKSDNIPPVEPKKGLKYLVTALDCTEYGGKQSYNASLQGLFYCTNQECLLYNVC